MAGVVSYGVLVWLALRELRPLLEEHECRRGGAKDLTIVPYVSGGLLYTMAGMFNPVGMILAGISAAAASFGGTSGMAWMTQCLGSRFAREFLASLFICRAVGVGSSPPLSRPRFLLAY